MMEWIRRTGFLWAALTLTAVPPAGALDITAAKTLLNENREAVVTVKMVTKYSAYFQGRQVDTKELPTEAAGVVLDSSGLTVASLLASNPVEIFSMFAVSQGSDETPKFDSEFSDVKLLLNDGVEIPAKVVLRDADLDLLFIKPEKKDKTFRPVTMGAAAEPEILDEVLVLGRLGNFLNREVFLAVERISAVIRKPRSYYLISYSGHGLADSAGVPVLRSNGSILGILLIRKPPAGQALGFESLLSGGNLLPVVVPIQDILEVAKQAP